MTMTGAMGSVMRRSAASPRASTCSLVWPSTGFTSGKLRANVVGEGWEEARVRQAVWTGVYRQ